LMFFTGIEAKLPYKVSGLKIFIQTVQGCLLIINVHIYIITY
ncbi:uncharacterized protein METZ01_LOCUS178275, partial [marine metagenome]